MQGTFSFPLAQGRAEALGEIHARPHLPVGPDRAIIQLAFLTEGGSPVDHAVLSELSLQRGIAAPARDAQHVIMDWGPGRLRWERHTEFSTYLWDCPAPKEFGAPINSHPFGDQFNAPGSFISGVRIEVRHESREPDELLAGFDPVSVTMSDLPATRATVITDFRQDGDGLTRILVIDRGMSDGVRGALCQRLIDIETYRTLATLGLSLARSLSPDTRRMEDRLTAITQDMKGRARDQADELLAQVTALAAELEASAALSLYRFGASRAYYAIVRERIAALGETPAPGHETLGSFLDKRLGPAMRTCQSMEERQANLSRKLARATTLIRSWIDVELERQNSALLKSMNRRVKLQLRLQQTVEGLSVAAISYYVVGLFGYLAKSVEHEFPAISAGLLTGLFVPVALVSTWLVVRSIRSHHAIDDEELD
ncbi:MAG: Egg lysin [Rhizobiales bacterium]|nr:Egg lysin [Hyphomicrobiales bacterium]MBA68766.1 Egg lysin [Hyphomicrobiales bacterium]